jgi:hypothetical protein
MMSLDLTERNRPIGPSTATGLALPPFSKCGQTLLTDGVLVAAARRLIHARTMRRLSTTQNLFGVEDRRSFTGVLARRRGRNAVHNCSAGRGTGMSNSAFAPRARACVRARDSTGFPPDRCCPRKSALFRDCRDSTADPTSLRLSLPPLGATPILASWPACRLSVGRVPPLRRALARHAVGAVLPWPPERGDVASPPRSDYRVPYDQ